MHSLRTAFLACLLVMLPPAGAGPRTEADIKSSQQQFETVADLLRKRLAKRRDMSDADREVLSELRFAYQRAVPAEVRNERRFSGTRIVLTDGWVALAEALLQAQAVAQQAGRPACFQDFAALALRTARTNQDRTAAGQTVLLASPRLEAHLVDAMGRRDHPCHGVDPGLLQRPALQQAVADGLDAALTWLVGRQIALLLPDRSAGQVAAASCPTLLADARASDWAHDWNVSLAPAAAVVFSHTVLASDPTLPRPCIGARDRFKAFAARWLDDARRAALEAARPPD